MSSSGKVFFLDLGGRIDHGHHDNLAKKALEDTVAFSDAVQKAVDMTDEEDTLIVVTADHSHVFTMGGYVSRGNPILGDFPWLFYDNTHLKSQSFARCVNK